MDKVIFEVEISSSGPRGWETAAVLELPATWAEFHDALQKARIEDGRFCRNELLHIRDSGFPDSVIGQDVNLYDLNLFAQRLAALNDTQGMGMKALLEMERHDGPIPNFPMTGSLGRFCMRTDCSRTKPWRCWIRQSRTVGFRASYWHCWVNSIGKTMEACLPDGGMRKYTER